MSDESKSMTIRYDVLIKLIKNGISIDSIIRLKENGIYIYSTPTTIIEYGDGTKEEHYFEKE